MNGDHTSQLTRWLYEACVLEVTSSKPGNVGPQAEFHDATVQDFLDSARVSAPILAGAERNGVGKAVFDAVSATQQAVGHNTNLGILLLLAPLAAVPLSRSLDDGIGDVLSQLTVADAEWTYKAIRAAAPGGLGDADTQDVRETPTETLLECMQLAADRDLIAAQYTNGFTDVLQTGLKRFQESQRVVQESQRIAWLALQLMSEHGDSLIARKCGEEMSQEVRRHAADVLANGWPEKQKGCESYQKFDAWLRSDGHRLNPGTTADLIAAILFAELRRAEQPKTK